MRPMINPSLVTADSDADLGERFLTDDGTMEGVNRVQGPFEAVVFEEAVEAMERTWVVAIALIAGVGLGLTVAAGQAQSLGQRSAGVLQPLAVLQLQGLAMADPADAALNARAIHAGEQAMESNLSESWSGLIQENHEIILSGSAE